MILDKDDSSKLTVGFLFLFLFLFIFHIEFLEFFFASGLGWNNSIVVRPLFLGD